jgi:hypothetical protein
VDEAQAGLMVSETATSGAAGTHVKQKELRDMVRQMARNAESLLATALSAHVVKKSARLSVTRAVRSKRFWPRSSFLDSRRPTPKVCSRRSTR